MRRSTVTNNEHDQSPSSSTNTTEMNDMQQKRSLEDYGFSTNSKRRRHLSPQNANIDLANDSESIPSPVVKKKGRAKSKNQSILDSSMDTSALNDSQTARKTSSRHTGVSSQQLTDITLPHWERVCPNIDQILSHKHTQSGVFAHEVHLVQQELEALLSMSTVRNTILKDLHNPGANNSDRIRSKIRKHQEAERIYSSKKVSKKPVAPLLQQHRQRQTGQNALLDRQVTMAPIVGTRIDRIWSEIDTYCRDISSNDMSTMANLVDFHRQFETKLEHLKCQYQQQTVDPSAVVEQLNDGNYEPLTTIAQINPLVTHYLDRTTLGAFRTKLYEHIGQTSPVYKTPISSPLHGRMLGMHADSKDSSASLRISPRLHSHEPPTHRTGLFSGTTPKADEDLDGSSAVSTTMIRSKKRNKFLPSPSSTIKFQQRLQLVQNYLTDQHLSMNENVKRQLFHDGKSAKKRKTSTSIALTTPTTTTTHDPCSDTFAAKLGTLISLVHECSSITSTAFKRAQLQSDSDKIRLKLTAIEHDLQLSLGKLNPTGSHYHATTDKALHHLSQLIADWETNQEAFDEKFQELFNLDQIG